MKRRLSVGISTIGDPTILFMDEPTTGLDPVNKRRVWHMIQELKESKVIVLTTHSMEEADVLSDKGFSFTFTPLPLLTVAIMAKGQVKCVGKGIELKKRYGSGYRIQVVSERPEALSAELLTKWKFMKLQENQAGSLQFSY